MTDRELKRMSRGELLELLIAQMAENERLETELESAQAALRDRRIVIENAGSLAEAAMQLNGVFDAAQAAAQQYLENLRQMHSQQDALAQKIKSEADAYSRQTRAEADAYVQKARTEADSYWNQVQDKVRDLLKEHGRLQDLLQQGRDSRP